MRQGRILLCISVPPHTTEHPVGFWSDWSDWTACSITCYKKEDVNQVAGTKTRHRVCSIPGACLGQQNQIEECYPTVFCPESKFKLLEMFHSLY